MLWKANINFIEVLFSEEQFIENTLEGNYLLKIIKNKNELAKMNLPYLWDACIGMHYNKFKLLQKGTKGTQYLVDKYGYDTKQAQHCYRVLDFLERYYNNSFSDFKQAIWYNDGRERDLLIDIKHGKFTLNKFIEMVQSKREDIGKLKNYYKLYEPNTDLYYWLNKQIKEIIKISLYKDLKGGN